MAQLSTIVGSILRDMVLAQHQANMYARSLSGLYSKDGALEHFPLPGIALGELELDLRYSVKDGENHAQDGEEGNKPDEQYEVNYGELPKILKRLSDSYASIVLSATNGTLKKLFPMESMNDENPLAKLETNPLLKNQIETYLSRKILEDIRMEFPRLILETKGEIRSSVLKSSVIGTSEDELLNHEELKDIFQKDPMSKDKVRTAIKSAVESATDALLEDVNVMRKRLMPSAEVIISSEELAKLPSDSIQRLHLKLSPRDMIVYEKE